MSTQPRWWNWDDDGSTVEGAYVRLDVAPAVFDDDPILILAVAGELRAVRLSSTVLRSRFVDELARRGSRDFEPGERIAITRGAEKQTGARGCDHWPIVFHDAPPSKRDALSILVAADESPKTQGDEIPF